MTEAHEGTADPRLEAEGELSMARLALDGGDLRHAADHVATAITFAPALPEIHELLAHLARHPQGGADLFPMDERVYLGTVVCRGHVLASLGDRAEAVRLLVSAQCHSPGHAWADVPWMYDPGLGAALPPEAVCDAIGRLLGVAGDPVPEAERAAFAPFLSLVRSAIAAHPGHAMLLWSASILVRRLGDTDAAVELALRSARIEPSAFAAVALGTAYRAQGRWAQAEQAWRQALDLEPDNLAVHTDMAEMLAEAGRPEDGLAWVEAALRKEPDHPSAFPTACVLRFGRDGDLAHLVALADHLRARPDNAHAAGALARAAHGIPWVGRYVGPTEAVVNMLHQSLESVDGTGTPELTVALYAPEPPSALLAFVRALPGSDITVGDIQPPDPRYTVPEVFGGDRLEPVRRRLWDFDGTAPRPNVAPPSASAAETMRDLALRTWQHPVHAYDEGVRLAGLGLTDLLGVLVHPPEPPMDEPGVWPDWIRLVQIWACLGLTHYEADRPWHGSVRRRALVDLAFGPEDWVTEAALFALVALAWTHPDDRADIAGLVTDRFHAAVEAAGSRPVTILDSIAHLVLATPEVEERVRAFAREVLAEE
ncbi:tetratricopeptide repeat protein [Nocardiopsis aegyptia]|uniref:Tetratricopeptide (TPR) repeat protein n=1 Tax=Nocardiopsis aegyptia TaxID=220378 RepID=A0A7Z0EKD3_9ACTN|nr:tetratricopeptide repeat protein [Nocardiopsis aegyptia]NYJ33695.1 tetratricopeptide (TPR) repeat protein [Nocardiopsis aegyptia]